MVFDQTEYMRTHRERKKTFSVLIDRERIEKLEDKLKEKNISKTKWLEEKIDEEIDK